MNSHIKTGLLSLILLISIKLNAQNQSEMIDEFTRRIEGEFTTERMASENPTRAHVILTVKPIWKDRSDGYWFFLEQAEFFRKDLPYRSVVLHVFEEDGKVISRNYNFHNKDIFLDVDERPFPIEKFTPGALENRYCDIIFERDASGNFLGKTPEGGCDNTYKGARFFTNESYLTTNFLISWDRGWKNKDDLAWGPEDFGYLFEKNK